MSFWSVATEHKAIHQRREYELPMELLRVTALGQAIFQIFLVSSDHAADASDRNALVRPEGTRKPVNMISLVCRAFWSQLFLANILYLGAILTAAVPPFLIG